MACRTGRARVETVRSTHTAWTLVFALCGIFANPALSGEPAKACPRIEALLAEGKPPLPATAQEVANHFGSHVIGNGSTVITGIKSLDEPGAGLITFAEGPKNKVRPEANQGAVVLVPRGQEKEIEGVAVIPVADPRFAFMELADPYHRQSRRTRISPAAARRTGISPKADIHETAKLGKNITIGHNVVIGEGAEIGDGAVIEANTVIEPGAKVGANTVIEANSVIEAGVKVGVDGHISPHVTIREGATLGKGILIGNGVEIGDGAKIGDNTEIHGNTTVASGAQIGADCLISPKVTIHEGVSLGDRVVVQSQVVLGASGFGFRQRPGRPEHIRVPQTGTLEIGDDVQIGPGSVIDIGAIGATRIGKGTKMDSNVKVAHGTIVGEHCLFCHDVAIGGSARIGNNVVLGPQVGVADHMTIGDGARVAGQSGVIRRLKGGEDYAGTPAKLLTDYGRELSELAALPELRKTVQSIQKKQDPGEKKGAP